MFKSIFADKENLFWAYLSIVIAISFFVYFFNFGSPDGPYWDENYHIASAQKYVDGVFFMEPHPPLGKMILALGEVIFQPNKNKDTSFFLTTDYISNFPEGYSFKGMRFFPVLFAALASIFFFLILYRLSSSIHFALLFTSFYIFENAMVVHLRGAMLEGVQLFFVLAAVCYFVFLMEKKDRRKSYEYLVLGLLVGLAVSVKLNSAILCLLFVFLAYEDFGESILKLKIDWAIAKDFGLKVLSSIVGILVVFFVCFYIHFAISSKVVENRYYMASAEYKAILEARENGNPAHFFLMLRDYLHYIDNYEKGVPKWDPTKLGENGSPAYAWPFGYKSIDYRWAKYKGKVSYMYLQVNPLIWYSGLVGFLLAFILVGGKVFFCTPITDWKSFRYIVYFFILYAVYMIAMLRLERVMYMYHYFIPLLFSLILFFLIFNYFFKEYIEKNDKLLLIISGAFVLEIILVFVFFSPFTYYIPLDSLEFMKRVWLKVWDLVPVTY